MRRIEKELKQQSRELDKLIQAADSPLDDEALQAQRKPGPVLKWTLKILVLGIVLLFTLPPFYIPLEGVKTSRFFIRRRPETQLLSDLEFHKGVDIAAPMGAAVRPVAIGKIAAVGYSDSYGNFVEVDHLFGIRSVYAHLSSVETKEGRVVVPGFRPIGLVGQSGRTTGPHLHLEIRLGDTTLPPGAFLFYHNVRRFLIGF